ncbi:response regulator transcription factor [Desnuesiella massiliensis]|uniref:response regulator transcription factor n=1 Tax=Desnuesiella massiliensis TaxID=1650662 RepID=UPI0006E1D512|nr:response regulator [Desnuesiella massiliensis]
MFKVMIVDDMEIMRRQIKRLPLWGDSTEFIITAEAEDGQEALEKLQIESVDLLITDISMPRINGIELLKESKERCLASCVVFLSEHSEFNFAKEAIQHGIFDYLVKPVNYQELKGLLKRVEEYIKEKKKTQINIKNLEDKLLQAIDIYYPANQLNSIAKNIIEGNINIEGDIQAMVEDTFVALDHDILKTALVLQRVCNEIYLEIKSNYGWVEQFLDKNLVNDISLTHYNNIDFIKKRIMESIEALLLTINKFIFSSKKSPLIKEICNYIVCNIEKEINMSKISEALFLSKNYVGDIFRQETSITVGEYITMVKMERAKQLITEESLRSYEIAHRLGYNNVEYFGKLFKKHTGLSPIEFKNTFNK